MHGMVLQFQTLIVTLGWSLLIHLSDVDSAKKRQNRCNKGKLTSSSTSILSNISALGEDNVNIENILIGSKQQLVSKLDVLEIILKFNQAITIKKLCVEIKEAESITFDRMELSSEYSIDKPLLIQSRKNGWMRVCLTDTTVIEEVKMKINKRPTPLNEVYVRKLRMAYCINSL